MYLWTAKGMWGVSSMGLFVEPLPGSTGLMSVPPFVHGTMPSFPAAKDCYTSAGHGYRFVAAEKRVQAAKQNRTPRGAFLSYADIASLTPPDAAKDGAPMSSTSITDKMLSPQTIHRLLRDAKRILDENDDEREAIHALFAALRASNIPEREYYLYASDDVAPNERSMVLEGTEAAEKHNAIPPPPFSVEEEAQ